MAPLARRIYLDNAATSWPKPEAVYVACDAYQREVGVAAGRGSYARSIEASRRVWRARRAVADLLEIREERRIVFASNGTDALNLAIHGLDLPGAHVVTTVTEHNSVLRPLAARVFRDGWKTTFVSVDAQGRVDPADVQAALRPDTRLVVLSHASNVTGTIQPADAIGRLARDHGALCLLDAAQTLGELPVQPELLFADLIAAPGHKGLLGPLGTGVLYVGPRAEGVLRAIRQGGTGSHSEQEQQPWELPDRLEAGNLNVTSLTGLEAGVRWLLERGIADVRKQLDATCERLLAGLVGCPGLRLLGSQAAADRVAVVSVQLESLDPAEAAGALDAASGIELRAGLHCAPRMHGALGTLNSGGTLRFSPGVFTTLDEIDQTVIAVRELLASCQPSTVLRTGSAKE